MQQKRCITIRPMRQSFRFVQKLQGALAWAVMVVVAGPIYAQQPVSGDPPGEIVLNFPENLELKVLVDYVSKRLGINILYDEQIANRRVTIEAPQSIPESSLLGLLESALKMKGLALVDGGEPGWKRIVPAANLIAIARGPKEAQRLAESGQLGATLAVTRVFHLRHADAKRVDQLIKPFLTQPGGNSTIVGEHKLIIVTDYASNMDRVVGLIRLADKPLETIAVEFVAVEHQEASQLAQQALKLIRSKLQIESKQRAGGGSVIPGVDVTYDDRTNQVIVVGVRRRVDDAVAIVRSLDVSLDLVTKVYQFKVASPERIDRLNRELIGPLAAKRLYRSAVDQDGGFLVVATTEQIHLKIQALKNDLDIPLPESQSPIQIYKLANTTAADVLETIRAIETDDGLGHLQLGGVDEGEKVQEPGIEPPTGDTGQPPSPQREALQEHAGKLQPIQSSVRARKAIVAADTNTNSIIVVAQPGVQAVYERLIRMLDQRRPQVLVEVIIASLDANDGFSLGVEISHEHTGGDARTLTFSSFGLSDVNAATGGLSLTPGLGFNGAVISPDIADIVIRALKTNTRAKVVSAPRLLVNDNATGTLSSIAEEPFTSVNASDTVATTSFAGFVSAGTTITVTPHISEGDHLSLEYSISLNSFTGSGVDGIPPPRKTDSVQSVVTIPNGHTVIVGGLKRKDYSKTVNAVPLLGEIPILKHLFRNEIEDESEVTLFVFIRPIILRDDQFEDLKFLSKRDRIAADLPAEYPTSEPLVVN